VNGRSHFGVEKYSIGLEKQAAAAPTTLMGPVVPGSSHPIGPKAAGARGIEFPQPLRFPRAPLNTANGRSKPMLTYYYALISDQRPMRTHCRGAPGLCAGSSRLLAHAAPYRFARPVPRHRDRLG